jgi:hypothetical protein
MKYDRFLEEWIVSLFYSAKKSKEETKGITKSMKRKFEQ